MTYNLTNFKEWQTLHETKEALKLIEGMVISDSLGLRKLSKEERDDRVHFINGMEFAANTLRELGEEDSK